MCIQRLIKSPSMCSDLWRRMFIWWDGLANPCDVDYKSKLSLGEVKKNQSLNHKSKEYNELREAL